MDNNSNLFETYREDEQNFYNESRAFLINNRSCIEESEHYIADLLYDFVLSKKEEIERDYNAASILYPFWKNYPPEDRGRQPIGDQIPWIEVGERVLGTKLTRFLSTKFDTVLDTGIPSGADDRFVLAHDDIKTKLQISTVQGMVQRILYNDGDRMPAVTDFDLVIIDEAHRGYILDKEMSEEEIMFRDQLDYQSKYRNIIEYFDAVKIGFTASI